MSRRQVEMAFKSTLDKLVNDLAAELSAAAPSAPPWPNMICPFSRAAAAKRLGESRLSVPVPCLTSLPPTGPPVKV